VNALLADDFGFEHFLHGIKFLVLLVLNAPNLAESALANNIQIIKIKSIDLFVFDDDFVLLFLFLDQF
jgi:hypothetical protein